MAKSKKSEQQPAETYITAAEPKAWAGGVPVFCAHDAIEPIEKLIPNPRNPNTHPDDQIKALAKIIKGTGWRGAITVSKRSGFIVKGHGRLMAAQLADLTEAPVDYQNYASEAEEYADMIADNRLAELSQIDSKLLADLMAEVDTGEIPFGLTGYTEEEYGNIVAALSEASHEDGAADKEGDDLDAAPPEDPVTEPGDVWIVGHHRIVCGDSLSKKTIEIATNGEKADVVFTDPPYGMGKEADGVENDNQNQDQLLDFNRK